MKTRFHNRIDAGRRLAVRLASYAEVPDLLILALPRGGVPVAAEIAKALNQELDVLVVRKLGVPGHEEFAFGAIASGGVRVLNDELVAMLGLRTDQLNAIVEREKSELCRREKVYRKNRPAAEATGRTVMIVDDGVATGATMSAAIELLRHQQVSRIIVAVPVAPAATLARLREEADEVVALHVPEYFESVGAWYEDFSQTSDHEVGKLLAEVEGLWKKSDTPEWAASVKDRKLIDQLREEVRPLTDTEEDYDALLEWVGDSEIVLLGESSHGTHEFYRQRAELTKRLIGRKGFSAVAVEADWPDAYRVNRYVRGQGSVIDARVALEGFVRFPAWMWRNEDVLDFIGWLREYNRRAMPVEPQVGFYGLDLYSLHKSMDEVLGYLDERDAGEAAKARALYGCIDRYGRDPQNYGLMVTAGIGESCRSEVIEQLAHLRAKEADFLGSGGLAEADEFFNAEQNARVVKNAEQYYRKMFVAGASSWNQRDEHMMETLVKLRAHLLSHRRSGKIVVWAHNSHLGDARATDMSRRGEWNLGQLVRQSYPKQSKVIGYTTYSGTVTAAAGWHLPAECKTVSPGLEGSYEYLFHHVGERNFWLDLRSSHELEDALMEPRLERAIGVVYLPESERRSHYFHSVLPRQFDAVIHFDHTRAVEPLERFAAWSKEEAPETYPIGL
jgi:erythromycin esterase-like protein/predicted phosphoribosyltransferase